MGDIKVTFLGVNGVSRSLRLELFTNLGRERERERWRGIKMD